MCHFKNLTDQSRPSVLQFKHKPGLFHWGDLNLVHAQPNLFRERDLLSYRFLYKPLPSPSTTTSVNSVFSCLLSGFSRSTAACHLLSSAFFIILENIVTGMWNTFYPPTTHLDRPQPPPDKALLKTVH